MNVDDVKDNEIQIPADHDIWPAIFQHQLDLYRKYFDIERQNGFYKPEVMFEPDNLTIVSRPHIDDRRLQHWLKDMFWRTTEEIAEALEPMHGVILRNSWPTDQIDDPDIRHFFEELADALHFFVEASAILQFNPQQVYDTWKVSVIAWKGYNAITDNGIRQAAMDFILELGLSANCLKNKPWKTSHMPTDEPKFRTCVLRAWGAFSKLFQSVYCDLPMVYRLYFKKNQVNKFRQRTNY